jgi:hypothetical protein
MENYMDTNSALSIPARIRGRLREAPALTQTLQAGRALLHFGPWRHAARAMVRRNRPPLLGYAAKSLSPLQLNASQLVQSLRVDGIAMANQLPPDVLGRVRAVTDELRPGEYGDFQEQPDVRSLVQCADVLDVVRSYLGAEPELLECTLVIHHAEDPGSRPIHPQRLFHFDYAGWQSLNLFVYLTDVQEDSGAHQVVVGSHTNRNLRDAIRPWIPDEAIMARYAGRTRTITGPAGTMFFEDTEAFHRRLRMKRRRAMLNILYASNRSWLSRGRLTPKYSDYLRARGVRPGHQGS